MKAKATHIIVLSGPTGVGKTRLALELVRLADALHVSTSSLISNFLPSVSPDRTALQRAGNDLDQQTNFCWIADEVAKLEHEYPDRSMVIDAVRKPEQIRALREKTISDLTHVHLEASYDHLVHRHRLRSRDIDAGHRYDLLVKDDSESYQSELAFSCDIKLDSAMASPCELGEKVISLLNVAASS
uniref:hypothetical protein n=1 Tax=Pararhizobium sp. IMCC3301 TaxID=3067904 RepID=UPI0027425065|nr:hypothetical protein [Pararhizobium sp. IMCC3301]